MNKEPILMLADIASEAHARIQQDFLHIDPVIGVSRSMRKSGIPADAMTIDCLKTGKRIIIILHDKEADIIRYQFSYKDKDPGSEYEVMSLNDATSQTFYDWISHYFSTSDKDEQ